jgi:hypothetical protein
VAEMNIPKYKFLNYLYLVNAKTNMEGKLYLLEQMQDKADELLKKQKDDVAIRKLHFLQLDIISKLCYVIEDYLYLHYLVRKDTKKIYKEIIRNTTKWANDEAVFIEKHLKNKDIRKVYCYPEIATINLSKEEKNILKDVIRTEMSFHRKNMKEIASFWNKHRKIYNVYKHGCSIVTGMRDLVDMNKASHFYARGKERNKIKTYMIESTDRLFQDYDGMRMKIHAEYNSLALNNETKIINKDQPFLPNLFCVNNSATRDTVIEIGKRINKKILSPGEMKILLEMKENALKKIRGRSDYYIAPIKKDIMFSYKGSFNAKRTRKTG